jgi:hypothetical protein
VPVKESSKQDLVYSPDSTINNLTFLDWIVRWCNWIFGIPLNKNPINDKSGKNCGNQQPEDVNMWFLATAFRGPTERTCRIHAGKPIFVPICVEIASEGEKKDSGDLISYSGDKLKKRISDIKSLEVLVDGVKITNMEEFRIHTTLNLSVEEDNVYGFRPGIHSAVANGYWLILKPVPVGDHKLWYSWDGKQDNQMTYNLTIS